MMITYKSSPQGLYINGLLPIIINPMPHLVNPSRHLLTQVTPPLGLSLRAIPFITRTIIQPAIFLAALQQTTKELPISM
jgi:hypothetical protein